MNGYWTKEQFEYLLTLKDLTRREAVEKLNSKYPKNQKSLAACYTKLCREGYPGWSEFQKEETRKVKPRGRSIKEQIGVDREIARYQAEAEIAKNKYNVLIKEKALDDKIVDEFRKNLLSITTTKPLKYHKPKGTESVETLGIMLSDSHIGEVVSSDETYEFEHYDFDVFRLRLQGYLDKTVNITQNILKGYSFNRVNVFMLGDIVTGNIHPELIETAEFPVTEQVLYGGEVISQYLSELAQVFPKIEVDCVFGNHGAIRNWGKKQYKHRYVNWDYLVYQYMKMRLENFKNIKFNIYKSFFALKEVEGKNFLILHGDDIRSWLNFPWYGIDRRTKEFTELLASRGKLIDYVLLGHFHRTAILDKVLGEVLVNASFMRGGEHILSNRATLSQPKQWMFGIHKEKGVTFRYPILLDQSRGSIRYLLDGEKRQKSDKNPSKK